MKKLQWAVFGIRLVIRIIEKLTEKENNNDDNKRKRD